MSIEYTGTTSTGIIFLCFAIICIVYIVFLIIQSNKDNENYKKQVDQLNKYYGQRAHDLLDEMNKLKQLD